MLNGREEYDPASRVVQQKGDLIGGERGVEGHGNRAEQQARNVADGPLRAVFTQNGDAISALDAPCVERVSGARHAAAEFLGTDRQPLPRFAVKQQAVEIALDGGEENIV